MVADTFNGSIQEAEENRSLSMRSALSTAASYRIAWAMQQGDPISQEETSKTRHEMGRNMVGNIRGGMAGGHNQSIYEYMNFM